MDHSTSILNKILCIDHLVIVVNSINLEFETRKVTRVAPTYDSFTCIDHLVIVVNSINLEFETRKVTRVAPTYDSFTNSTSLHIVFLGEIVI